MSLLIRYLLKCAAAFLALLGIQAAVYFKVEKMTDDMVRNSTDENKFRRANTITVVSSALNAMVSRMIFRWTVKRFYAEYEASKLGLNSFTRN